MSSSAWKPATSSEQQLSHFFFGVPGYPDGEGVQVKSSRKESEAPGEEGEEVKSPKRKVIRVESEETQDYVRESLDLNQEECEEISFVPSAIVVTINAVRRPSTSGSLRRW